MVRHAEVHNPKDIVYGRLPRFGLSARGTRQAERLGAFLAPRSVDVIYSSPLLRARQTAEIVRSMLPSTEYRRTSLILEVKSGFQGSPGSILKPGFSFYEPLKEEGDESMEVVLARMIAFLRLAVHRHPGHAVVAISHADPIAIMRLGLEGRELTVANLHRVVYPERVSVNQIVLTPGEAPQITYFDVARGVT